MKRCQRKTRIIRISATQKQFFVVAQTSDQFFFITIIHFINMASILSMIRKVNKLGYTEYQYDFIIETRCIQ